MKTLFCLVLALGWTSSILSDLWAEEHTHHAELPGMTLNHGQKWQADATLTEQMKVIQGAKSGAEIEKAIGAIFKNCKLPSQADQTLHSILIRLREGAKNMKSGAQFVDPQVLEALKLYQQYFQDVSSAQK